MIEPYRIKVCKPIRLIGKAEREDLLKKAYFNTSLLPAEKVYIDLLSDSGTSAISARSWAEIIEADEAFAYQPSYFKLMDVAKSLFGFPHILLVHQDRMGEHILFKYLRKRGYVRGHPQEQKGNYVLSNGLFETTRVNIEDYGSKGIDIPGELGDIDLERLAEFIKKKGENKISAVILTLTNNKRGGWPVSFENIKECKSLLSKYGIPLWFDGSRWAENIYFIKSEFKSQSANLRSTTKEVFSYGDGFFLSAKKSGLSSVGGLVGTRDEKFMNSLREFALQVDGFTSHGGMSGRDIAAMAQGLLESVNDKWLEFRIKQLEWFGSLFKGLPILKPIGGIGVYIKAKDFLPPHLGGEFPAMALSNEVWLEGGIRGAPWGDFYRLAVPRRVYTNNHLQYVADIVREVFKRRKRIKELKAEYFSEKLGIFGAKFKPKFSI